MTNRKTGSHGVKWGQGVAERSLSGPKYKSLIRRQIWLAIADNLCSGPERSPAANATDPNNLTKQCRWTLPGCLRWTMARFIYFFCCKNNRMRGRGPGDPVQLFAGRRWWAAALPPSEGSLFIYETPPPPPFFNHLVGMLFTSQRLISETTSKPCDKVVANGLKTV